MAKEEFYWPEQVDLEPTLEAFVEAFRTVGFEVSPDEESTNTDDEIALYAKGDDPKHASKKLEGGLWASKLGTSVDIKHEYKALEGNEYGEVVLKMERDT